QWTQGGHRCLFIQPFFFAFPSAPLLPIEPSHQPPLQVVCPPAVNERIVMPASGNSSLNRQQPCITLLRGGTSGFKPASAASQNAASRALIKSDPPPLQERQGIAVNVRLIKSSMGRARIRWPRVGRPMIVAPFQWGGNRNRIGWWAGHGPWSVVVGGGAEARAVSWRGWLVG